MTAPQYDPYAQYGQQPAPQGYAPPQPPVAVPGYQHPAPGQQFAPPAQPQQFQQQQQGYPVAPQGYGQPAPQYGLPQGYGQPQQPPAAPMPQINASLDDFYNQPSIGWGPAWQLGNDVQAGTSYIGFVAQSITKAHVEPSTNRTTGAVNVLKNGDPVLNLKVPLFVQRDQRFADGRAQFYVGPGDKAGLEAAMQAVGAPAGPPELGAMIRVTKTGSRKNSFGTNSSVKAIEYWRPSAELAAYAQQMGIEYPDLSATPQPAAQPTAPDPVQQAAPAPAPVAQPPAQQYAPPAPPVQQVPAPVQQLAQPPAAAPVDPQAAFAQLAGDPQRQALLASLLAQQPPAA